MEFIFGNYIKIHPLALLHPEAVQKKEVRKEIQKLTKGYEDGRDYFIQQLSQGIGIIAAAFYPRVVILRQGAVPNLVTNFRFSDFKTNEYAHLIGGDAFEPTESNPMLGWRGGNCQRFS
jgi:pyruvate,water dikinase